ncbi:MAG: MBL fold metallo-hydrolase [Candidatus Hatepunaea meridiana]|nr:MBL fold metallo-hydrolase [Candidatus Hatepunaea meridiana]
MKITFWGTRGSIPAPGQETVKIGGNTTCLEVFADDEMRVIVDAGTGIRKLGASLMKEMPAGHINLLLTHSHWDHLAGYTFFAPAYSLAHSISVYGNPMAQEVLRHDIYGRNDNRYFPVNMDDLRADIEFHDELINPLILGSLKITTMNLNHPGNGYAYLFECGGKRVAFVTDNELGLQYPGGNTPKDIISFCQGVDVLIHDAQFTPDEIEKRRGWGHSTYVEVADLAHKAGVPHIYLTHHAPEREDNDCEIILKEANRYIKKKKYNLSCELAIEGDSFSV